MRKELISVLLLLVKEGYIVSVRVTKTRIYVTIEQ